MKHTANEVAEKIFHSVYDKLGEKEKRIVTHLAERTHISRNTNSVHSDQLTFGQRLADKVASFGGSWPFIMIFGAVLVVWVVLNSLILVRFGKDFDPFPYILLNLFLSMIASIQAPIIMMSQNRHSEQDRLNAEHDYEVNLKAEVEIMTLHEKVDVLREKQWTELISLQQEQISLLTKLLEKKEAEK